MKSKICLLKLKMTMKFSMVQILVINNYLLADKLYRENNLIKNISKCKT